MLLERMYTHIAAAAEVFTNFAPFIVSQYVTELQKVHSLTHSLTHSLVLL
jgi:hypothetical protein